MFKNHRMSHYFVFYATARIFLLGILHVANTSVLTADYRNSDPKRTVSGHLSRQIKVWRLLWWVIFSHHHPSLGSIQPLKLKVQPDNKQVDTLYQTCCMRRGDGVGAPPRSTSNLPDKNRSQKMLKHFVWPEAQVRGVLVFLLSLAVSNTCKVKLVKAH